MSTLAAVRLWGRRIGAVSLAADSDYAAFEYEPAFVASRYEVAPLTMPLSTRIYVFPNLSRESFHGLPGLLADSLPDRFGNALIDAWLATQGRGPESFNAVERLCYVGTRGMGALEFEPATGPQADAAGRVEVAALVALASRVLQSRNRWQASLDGPADALTDILRVGTSAGGARAKAIIAWNPDSNEVRSGQSPADLDFEHWLLKFDGVAGNKDKELEDPKGYGAIEYAYYKMARAAGITMSPCRLLEENGRRHFMSKRFDRKPNGEKLHMQSLAALAHFDYNQAGAYSYEQALQVVRRLELPMDTIEEQFRRTVFNVLGRNQDDHVKNIAFLMDKSGQWSLAPAFDVTYSYNPAGAWTSRHQMSINGKRDELTRADFRALANTAAMKRGRADAIIEEVGASIANFNAYAAEAKVADWQRAQIEANLRWPVR